MYPLREILRQAVKLLQRARHYLHRVCAGQLLDAYQGGRLSVDFGSLRVARAPELNLAQVLEAQYAGVIAAYHDVAELLGCAKPALACQGKLKRRVARVRLRTECSGPYLQALASDGIQHLRRGYASATHQHRVEPYSHAVFAASERLGASYALYTRERIHHVYLGVIRKIQRVIQVRTVCLKGAEQYLVAAALAHADTLLLHL